MAGKRSTYRVIAPDVAVTHVHTMLGAGRAAVAPCNAGFQEKMVGVARIELATPAMSTQASHRYMANFSGILGVNTYRTCPYPQSQPSVT